MTVIDELHAWHDREAVGHAPLCGAAARRQPSQVEITTAGDDKQSVVATSTYAKGVLRGDAATLSPVRLHPRRWPLV